MSGWTDFFEDVLEKTPMPVRHKNVLANIHPNKDGKWIWNLSMREGSNPENQTSAMKDMLSTVGEGELTTYTGGSTARIIFVSRLLTQDEINKLPANVENIIQKFEESFEKKFKEVNSKN